jgi:ribosomal protein L29
MKKNDLTTRSATELHTMLQEARAKIAQLRFDLADKKLKNTSDINATRRQIARIMTILKSAK